MRRLTLIAAEVGELEGAARSLLTARICLAAVFLYSGTTKAAFWSAGLQEFGALGLPLPAALLAATIAVQIGAGLALAVGWRTELAALALAAFTILATIIGHPFWTFEGADLHRQLTTALEHLAIVGGLVAIAAAGPSPHSLDLRKVLS